MVLIPIVLHRAYARVRDVVFVKPFMPKPRDLLNIIDEGWIIQAIIKTYYQSVKVTAVGVLPKPSG